MDLTPTCHKCGETLNANSMRTVSFGKYACKVCPKDQNMGISVEDETLKSEKEIFFDKTYECGDCGFKFNRAPTFKVDNCPYCASERLELLAGEITLE